MPNKLGLKRKKLKRKNKKAKASNTFNTRRPLRESGTTENHINETYLLDQIFLDLLEQMYYYTESDFNHIIEWCKQKKEITLDNVINYINIDRNTLLHHAVLEKKPEIVKLLLSNDCDITIVNNDGLTALDICNNLLASEPTNKDLLKIKDLLNKKQKKLNKKTKKSKMVGGYKK